MNAYVFPGQGSQYTGMANDLIQALPEAEKYLLQANEILQFDIFSIMKNGSDEDLKQTKVTQPAIFIHSVALALCKQIRPDMVAGHSLGEYSALVASGCLSFVDALQLVYQRALAMQDACEQNPSTMAAVLGLDDAKVEEICASITDHIVVTANYNCPGQLVISGSIDGIKVAMEILKSAGAKRVLPLPVGGAFHSPLMESARLRLATAIENTTFNNPTCPVYQNVNAQAVTNAETIKSNVLKQLTAPVLWTQSVKAMVQDGATTFTECGPGKVLQGLVKKIAPEVIIGSL